jgi:gamma-glutamyltranspeptidase/glutathione hydrolase
MIYQPPPHVTQHWHLTKPSAIGRRGMVVSQSKDAADAGVAVLEEGGNAADAAVATALALATAEPWNSGLGGIGFALVHRAGAAAAEVVDFGPVAPAALEPGHFKLTGEMKHDLFSWPAVVDDANIHGPLSFAVPSAPAGYGLLHERFGRMNLADLFAPALALARRGLPADWFTTLKIANSAAVLRRYAESARIYLPDGLPPVPPYQGSPRTLVQGRLADTLARLQHAGMRDFYQGDIAASIAADVSVLGGVLAASDLHAFRARCRPAQSLDWRGHNLQTPGGLTAAPTLAAVLERMREVPLGAAPDGPWFRAVARAMKLSYAERLAGLGEAEPLAAESCTSHLTVCDAEGMMVSMTTTLLSSMGSRVVLPQSGVLMNNGVMWFDPRPNQPNSLSPGKRPLTNMCPVIMTRDGQPWIAAGASGGRRIMASVFQLLSFVADFGMDPQAAAHQPRIDVSDPGYISADRRLPTDVLALLAEDGEVRVVDHSVLPVNFACPNMILQQPDGMRVGISDAISPWSAAVAQQ